MEYLNSFLYSLVNADETYFAKAERLKCEGCKTLPDTSCHCIQCVANESIIEAYYNSMKCENDIRSAQILLSVLPHKIETSIKEIDKTAKYEEMLVETKAFIQNNPPEEDNV